MEAGLNEEEEGREEEKENDIKTRIQMKAK